MTAEEYAIDRYQDWASQAPDEPGGPITGEAPAAAAHIADTYADPPWDTQDAIYTVHVVPEEGYQCLALEVWDDGERWTDAGETWEWQNDPFCEKCPARPS